MYTLVITGTDYSLTKGTLAHCWKYLLQEARALTVVEAMKVYCITKANIDN